MQYETSDFALTFDCYGTLIDWETGGERASPLTDRMPAHRRRAGTQHDPRAHALESAQQRQTPQSGQRLRPVYRRLAGEHRCQLGRGVTYGHSVGTDRDSRPRAYLKQHSSS